MNGEINWSQPIEAVHEDGRVFPAHQRTDTGYEHSICWHDGKPLVWEFFDNGTPWPGLSGWRIRNVGQATETGATAPSGGEVASSDLVERMTALVRRMAGNSSMGEPYEEDRVISYSSDHYHEARAIVALLPEPVDGDLVAAREACAAFAETIPDHGLAQEYRGGDMDDQFEVKASLFAIRRALEKEAGR